MCNENASRIPCALLVVWVGCFVGAASGCNGDDDDAELRAVHAVPDAPSVDVYIAGEGEPLVSDLDYGESSSFEGVIPGTYEIEIREAGADPTTPPLFTSEAVDVFVGAQVSAILGGPVEATDDDALRLIALEHAPDDVGEDMASVRAVHASPDAPAIDLDIGADGSSEIEGLEPFTAAPALGIPAPEDDFQLAAFAEGERLTAFTLPPLDEGEETLLVAIGLAEELPREERGLRALVVGEDGGGETVAQNPALTFVHAVSDGPAVDVFLGAEESEPGVLDLEFGMLAEPLQVPPGELDADVVLAGTDQILLGEQTDELAPGQRYLMVIAGNAGRDDLELLSLGENFERDGEEPRARVVHASPDAPSVDVSLVEEGSLSMPAIASDLEFAGDAPDEGATLPAGAQTVGLAPAGEASPIATFDLEVPERAQIFAVVAGAVEAAEGEEPLQLFAVDTSIFPWELAIAQAE